MSDKEVVETVYGKHHKYEIVKDPGLFSATKYYIRRDGKPFKGSYSSLRDAVEAAENEG